MPITEILKKNSDFYPNDVALVEMKIKHVQLGVSILLLKQSLTVTIKKKSLGVILTKRLTVLLTCFFQEVLKRVTKLQYFL